MVKPKNSPSKAPVVEDTADLPEVIHPETVEAVAEEAPAESAPPVAAPEIVEGIVLIDGQYLGDPTPFLRAMNEAAKRLVGGGRTLGVQTPEGAARRHLAAFLQECVDASK